MPHYATKCTGCAKDAVVNLTFTTYKSVKEGLSTLECASCHQPVELVFQPSALNVSFKDGPSGGWVSKAVRENKYRAARGVEMDRRSRDHVRKTTLQPNFGGELTGTWKEAQAQAFETARTEVKGNTGDGQLAMAAATAAAATYDPLVKGGK